MKTSDFTECPLIPMWAITGNPSRGFLYERMKNFRACGITQLMIPWFDGSEEEYRKLTGGSLRDDVVRGLKNRNRVLAHVRGMFARFNYAQAFYTNLEVRTGKLFGYYDPA